MIIDNAVIQNVHPFLSLTVSEISPFYIKITKLAVFSKFWTHDLEGLSPYYEKAPLLSIENIAAKFVDATSCCYRDMFRTKKIAKSAVFSKFWTHDLKVLSPYYEKALLLNIGNTAAKFEDATPCSYRDMLGTKMIRKANSPKAKETHSLYIYIF